MKHTNANRREGRKNDRKLSIEAEGTREKGRRNIVRAHVTKSMNFKEEDIMI
jgi:hypothetical protein